MEDKTKNIQEAPDNTDDLYNAEDLKNQENDNIEYEYNKAKLSKKMIIYIILILSLFGLLVFLNKYFNG